MEKRLLLAALCSLAVLFLWDALVPKPNTPVRPPARTAAAPVGQPAALAAAPAPRFPASAPVSRGEFKAESASAEQEFVIDRALYRATFSNRGAVLTSFLLKKYDDDQGHPLDLIHSSGSVAGRALRLNFGADEESTHACDSALYAAEHSKLDSMESLVFRFSDGRRLVEKRFRFADTYLFDVVVSVRGAVSPVLEIGPGLRNLTEKEKENRFTGGSGAVIYDGAGLRQLPRGGVKEAKQAPMEGAGFVGLEDNYFLAVILPARATTWRLTPVFAEKGAGKPEIEAGVDVPGELAARLYFGPKDLDLLRSLNLHLEETVRFSALGIDLAIIARPLLWLLKASYRHVFANWGVSILLVTLLVRLLLFPLTQKSYVGMKKMQKLQPRINAVRGKYKNIKMDADQRAKMNKEMMEVYAAEGASPMGGCLPMLVQMPILFAFYIVLERSLFLRHAPFWLWIHDLSAKDSTYTLVVLMTVTMFLQQAMTPSAADPAQKRMFLMMPFLWGFFMKEFPSGLVLYMLFSNILTILQQMLINRMYKDGSAPAPARTKAKSAADRG